MVVGGGGGGVRQTECMTFCMDAIRVSVCVSWVAEAVLLVGVCVC